jgi:DNA-binding CsgD family transcriptional regulator
MVRQLNEETIQQIEQLFQEGKNPPEIAKLLSISRRTAYSYTKGKEKGHPTITHFQTAVAQRQGYQTLSQYQAARILRNGYQSVHHYQEERAKENGFDSDADYKSHCSKERQQRAEYQLCAYLVRERLKELELTQAKLSQHLKISPQAVNNYCNAKTIPKKEHLQKILDYLKLDKNTLDDLF